MSADFTETEFVAQKGYDLLSAPRAIRALELALLAGESTVQIGLDPTRPALSAHLCLPTVALLDQRAVTSNVNPMTQQLCAVWADVLQLAVPVDEEADIFDLGATSLDLPRAQEAISRILGCDIDVLVFFDHPTIGDFSAHLQSSVQQIA